MRQRAAGKMEAQSAGTQKLLENYELNLSDFALFMSVMKVKKSL